jgi:hypothetical protein
MCLEGLGAATENFVKLPGVDAQDLSNAFQKPLFVYPTFTTSRPVVTYIDAKRSGGACGVDVMPLSLAVTSSHTARR